ncbi:MAG: peptide MFS transporter [Steroidobacteraceae bacterium]
MAAPAQRGFFGHPRALSTLFFTEMWERLSYYGMRALLVLFLVDSVNEGGFGLDDRTATAIYGLYTAGVYLAGLPGGWIADRLLGSQTAVLIGGLVIALGHVLLGLSGTPAVFYFGLLVIVLGTGLLKPNISALVGTLYPEGGARCDAGYTIFYLGVNLGGLFGPLMTATLAQRYGWHIGFLAAAVGMALGVGQFVRTRRHLGTAGLHPHSRSGVTGSSRGDWLIFTLTATMLLVVILLVWAGIVPISPVALQGGAINVIVAMAAAYFLYLLCFAGLDGVERRRVLVLLVLFIASSVFWAGFEQAGSSLNLFAERHTDRLIGSFEIPSGWFQSLNSTFIILCAPLLSALWVLLARRGRNVPVAIKFVCGLLGMAVGFLVMAAASKIVADGEMAGPVWLTLTYFFHTLGELCLSPVGMSATTKLAPQRFVGQSMGVWFVSLSLGNLIASRIAGDFDASNVAAMPGQYMAIFWFGAVAALTLLLLSPLVKRWTGGVE